MEYREFKPSEALAPFVESYWVHAGEIPGDQIYRCVPSGNTDIIIGTSDGKEFVRRDDRWEKVPRAFLTGIWTEPALLKSAQRIEWFGIRLKPEVFVQMFRRPLREMENATLDVSDVLGKSAGEMAHRIAEATDLQQRIQLAEHFIACGLARQNPENIYFTEAIRLIRQHGGRISTVDLSKKVFVGERQLQRAFREHFGITPKTYARLMRFNRATAFLKDGAQINWADITYTCGYADQAHFIRDFKEFSGSNPTTLVTDPSALVALPSYADFQ